MEFCPSLFVCFVLILEHEWKIKTFFLFFTVCSELSILISNGLSSYKKSLSMINRWTTLRCIYWVYVARFWLQRGLQREGIAEMKCYGLTTTPIPHHSVPLRGEKVEESGV